MVALTTLTAFGLSLSELLLYLYFLTLKLLTMIIYIVTPFGEFIAKVLITFVLRCFDRSKKKYLISRVLLRRKFNKKNNSRVIQRGEFRSRVLNRRQICLAFKYSVRLLPVLFRPSFALFFWISHLVSYLLAG
jgi:hypothetical protein